MVMGELPVEAEVLIMGGGPGGYSAAFRAAELGLDVTLITDEPWLGGVCLLRGCIPSKAPLSLADQVTWVREATAGGLRFGDPDIDLERMRAWKGKIVEQLAKRLEHLCEQRGIHVVQGRARLTAADTVHLENVETPSMTFQYGIIATGSRPVPLPNTAFTERIMHSGTALELVDIPSRLLVVGGGYVGLELGMVYASLGSRVTLVEMTDRLLPHTDADLVKPLVRRLHDCFEGVYLKTKVRSLELKDNTVHVTFEGDADLSGTAFDRVLAANGHQPNSDQLGLQDAGVKVDKGGYVVVDAQRRTTNERLFAIGDVAGGMLLAHKAMYEGEIAAEVIAGHRAVFDARAIPAVVYTDPQIAWCGLSEQEAEAQNHAVSVARFPWKASGRALSMGASDGITKLITDAESQQILGVGIVGRDAEALIAEGVLAVEMGAMAQDLALSIHPHPTLSETLGEAAAMVRGSARHVLARND